jgi:hypothetical protein
LKFEDEAPSEQTVFNYLIQAYEIERSAEVLDHVLSYMDNMKSKAVLYTYDSILCDVSDDEFDAVITDVPKLLSGDDEFPVRVFVGDTYDDMIKQD